MGRTQKNLYISASVSSHNSEQDEIDRQLWRELCERVHEVVADEKYAHLFPMWN